MCFAHISSHLAVANQFVRSHAFARQCTADKSATGAFDRTARQWPGTSCNRHARVFMCATMRRLCLPRRERIAGDMRASVCTYACRQQRITRTMPKLSEGESMTVMRGNAISWLQMGRISSVQAAPRRRAHAFGAVAAVERLTMSEMKQQYCADRPTDRIFGRAKSTAGRRSATAIWGPLFLRLPHRLRRYCARLVVCLLVCNARCV